MRVIKVKLGPRNGIFLRGSVFLTAGVILVFLLCDCANEPEETYPVPQTLTLNSGNSREKLEEQQKITVHLPGLRKDAKKLEMVLIKPGSFLMGSPKEEHGHSDNEWLPHEVTITKPFYMGKYEVTQAQLKEDTL